MADLQRKTANLFDLTKLDSSFACTTTINDNAVTQVNKNAYARSQWLFDNLVSGVEYTIKVYFTNANQCSLRLNVLNSNSQVIAQSESTTSAAGDITLSFTVQSNDTYIRLYSNTLNEINTETVIFYNIMLNTGSTPKPYEPYGWQHSLRKLTTATEAVENPLYSDGTAITSYTIKGNTVQDGTPTPSNPVDVVGVGTLDSGQYKIPISSGSVTTNIYLGSTQTVRQIGCIDLSDYNFTYIPQFQIWECTTIPNVKYTSSATELGSALAEKYTNHTASGLYSAVNNFAISTSSVSVNTGSDSISPSGKLYYALATPETAAVNEPLMKIGDYADTLSNATTIPTTEGANSITVDTTVQPSEFTATWTGWHNASVKEYDGSEWQDEQPVSLLSASSRPEPLTLDLTPEVMDTLEETE